MKKINFVIDGDNAFVVKGVYLDLHNNYDFIGLKYEPDKRQLTLSWNKATGHWVPSASPGHIGLSFEGVSFLNTKLEKRRNRFIWKLDTFLHGLPSPWWCKCDGWLFKRRRITV